VERFGYYSASIYLVEPSGQNVILAEAAGPFSESMKEKKQIIPIGSRSMVGWVAAYNQPRVSGNVREEFFYRIDDLMTETRSEASLPISTFELHRVESSTAFASQDNSGGHTNPSRVLGVLDVQHQEMDAFDPETVAVLQIITNHIASVIQIIRINDLTRLGQQELSILFETSARLAHLTEASRIYSEVGKAVTQIHSPSILFVAQENELRKFSELGESNHNGSFDEISISISQLETLAPPGIEQLVLDVKKPTTYPQNLVQLAKSLQSDSIVIIPVRAFEQIVAMIVLGGNDPTFGAVENFNVPVGMFPEGNSQAVNSLEGRIIRLSQVMGAALESVNANQQVEKRMKIIESVNSVNQLISTTTSLKELYEKIFKEVCALIGGVDFLIAIYYPKTKLIHIPFMVEVSENNEPGSVIEIPPFPIGQGLSSVVINTRQPLRINEDTSKRAHDLGAILVGEPAKSWLGVPMLVSGEPVGVIVVQDRFREGRFSIEDQNNLVGLANQMAIVIRNALLLENTRKQAERERKLIEITSKIRSSNDLETIVKTAASELRKALNFDRARIDIDVETALASVNLDTRAMDGLDLSRK
jgi:GAF domain-containing protein